jgi:hypothetical protein
VEKYRKGEVPLILGLIALLVLSVGGAWFLSTPPEDSETPLEALITPPDSPPPLALRMAKALEEMDRKGLLEKQASPSRWVTATDPHPPAGWLEYLNQNTPAVNAQALHEAMPGADAPAEALIYRALILHSVPWSGDPARIQMEENLQQAIAQAPQRILQSLLAVAPRLDTPLLDSKTRAYELATDLATDDRSRQLVRATVERDIQLSHNDDEKRVYQEILERLEQSPNRSPANETPTEP